MHRNSRPRASEADEIVGLYQRHARQWAADRGAVLCEQTWLDRFTESLPSAASILDIGCGSGDPIARYLIGRGCRLTGIDSAPEMVALCREKFPDHDWRVEDMRSLRLGKTFDGLLAWDSFFHLSPERQRQMFPIFRDHTASNGRLMFTSGTSFGVAMGSYRGEPLYHASLNAAEYRALLCDSGFAVVDHVTEDPTCGRRTVWLARRFD